MNVQYAAHNYFQLILNNAVGIKTVILDDETMKFISVAMTKNELFKQEVALIEIIKDRFNSKARPPSADMDCICIVRPTHENIELIKEELQNPQFRRYELVFTNTILDESLKGIALSDTRELVHSVQEVFIDFSALNGRLFSLDIPDISNFRRNPNSFVYSSEIIQRLLAVLCSLRIKPVIRYERSSESCKSIAEGLSKCITVDKSTKNLFESDYRNATLLILDRRSDPVSPLIHFFDYSSSLHEFFTIDHNTITTDDEQKFIIDERTDPKSKEFFNSYLEDALKMITTRYNQFKKGTSPQNNDDTNQLFLQNIKGSQEGVYLSTHLTLGNKISEYVNNNGLLEICELEHIIAGTESIDDRDVIELINKSNNFDALKIALIYSLHFEGERDLRRIKEVLMNKGGWKNNEVKYIDTILRIAGKNKRSGDLFKNKTVGARFMKGIKSLSGEKSKFEIFKAQLAEILSDLKQGKLNENDYPWISPNKESPKKVIVFYVGGTLYEELKVVSEMSQNTDWDIIVGGNYVHNSKSFIENEIKPFAI
ncbi:Sec1 family protein [Histomonas meleagridis]|uniref:Sec1 family protein n=1 Tax=Histomonas meleagridis TaxID=135588 RepID=UPI00355A15D4|nr:Sec1 family protein [Histomonas meleagridis]KAH0801801.1 Sec1 family protein [Histomonas meleagridis]